jgi:hypothetical protein
MPSSADSTSSVAEWAKRTVPDIPYYVRALAFGLCPYLIAITVWTFAFNGKLYLRGAGDFRMFCAAGESVRTGNAARLYDYDYQLAYNKRRRPRFIFS